MPDFRKLVPSAIPVAAVAIVAATLAPLATNRAYTSEESLIPQEKVQPLDPLTPEETQLAAEIANSDRRVKAALGPGRQRLIQVEFFALKPADTRDDPERLQMGRHARVLFYRYEGDQGVDAVVDLQRKSVASVSKIEGVAVPLATDEITDAFNLAIKNERVRSLLGPRLSEYRVAALARGERPETRVEGLRVIATSPRDPCFRRRCIHLLFHDREGYIAGTTVTVNLTAQTVRAERTTP